DDALRVETERKLEPGRWHHVAVTYDGSRLAAGVKVYIDGAEAKTTTLLDELNQSFQTKEPLRIGSGGGPDGRFNGLVDEVRVYGRVIEPAEASVLAVAATPGEIVAKPVAERTAAETDKLRALFVAKVAPEEIRAAHEALRAAREERANFSDSIP